MSPTKKMNAVDHAWLRMDSPQNLMMICGVMVLRQSITAVDLHELFVARLLQHTQFTSRVQRSGSSASWVAVDGYDRDYHVQSHRLAKGSGDAELQDFVAALMSEPLAKSHPLWQFHLVDNFRGGQALIGRIHHCIADGIALIGVVMGLTDGAPLLSAKPAARESADWQAWLAPYTKKAVKAINLGGTVVQQALGALAEPARLTKLGELAQQLVKDAAQIALMPSDTATALKGKLGNSKKVAWSKPLPLAQVKELSKALGCSINDVLLACATGALRHYLLQQHPISANAEFRAMVPVSLRPPSKMQQLGNEFGLVPLLLPIGQANPIARVLTVRARMNGLKQGYQALIAMWTLGALGMAPKPLQQEVLDMLANKGSAVMTNVPGPATPLYLLGSPVENIYFWVPQSGNIGVGLSILSYNGQVQLGLVTDAGLCDNPQAIMDQFEPELGGLALHLLTEPWLAEVAQALQAE
jgi:diacylglycerol O-acyltransferase / wax synthase